MTALRIIVMGVSGCGKSTLGRALAARLGLRFVDGDALHPPANIAKMSAGIPLDDEDRWPYFDNVSRAFAEDSGAGTIVACSALKRSYRDFLRARSGDLLFVLPLVGRDELTRRLHQRRDHFMPASLIESQCAALEVPTDDEAAIIVDGTDVLGRQVTQALSALAQGYFNAHLHRSA